MYYLYMKEKLIELICVLEKGASKKFINENSYPFSQLKKALDTRDIKYIETKKFVKLSESKSSAIQKAEDFDSSSLVKKYDLSSVAEKMKQHPLSQKEIVKELHCKSNDYLNIITYMTHNFLIYEEDDGRVGCLEKI